MVLDLVSLGWDTVFAAAFPCRDPLLRPARVMRVEHGVCTVLSAEGVRRASLAGTALAAAVTDPARLPCVGDWVAARTWPDARITVEAVLPRRTAIVAPGVGKARCGRLLAANVDTVAVVEPLHSAPDVGRIERLLTLARESGAQPLVVLSKADLATEPTAADAVVARISSGVAVLPVSAFRGDGLDALRPLAAPGRTLALLGPCGAGKSTLVNALAGAAVLATRALRRLDGDRRPPGTYRSLVPIPGGGVVLDTSGPREMPSNPVDPARSGNARATDSVIPQG